MSNIQISIKQEKPDFGKEFSRIKDSFKQTDLSPLLSELKNIRRLLSNKEERLQKVFSKIERLSLPEMPEFNDRAIVSAINSLKSSLKEREKQEKEPEDRKMFERLMAKLNKLNLPTSITAGHKMPRNEAMLKELRSIKEAIDKKPVIVPYTS